MNKEIKLENVPPVNVLNYDESNFSYDAGKNKVIQ